MLNFYYLFGLLFPFLCTAAGALCVLIDIKIKDSEGLALGFSAGVMVAASTWSLLLPSIEMSEHMGRFSFIPAVVGMIFGGLFIALLDFFLRASSHRRETKLFWAVTVHNIPEGLAVGFAFGSPLIPVTSAFSIALAIGLQNFPEGLAVALPYFENSKSRKKGVLAGVLSGVVEPVGAILGIFLAMILVNVQPWILSFAAGAMLFVTAGELIPDGCKTQKGSWSFLIGFCLMLALDVAFS